MSPATPNLSDTWRYPIATLCGGTGSLPVVRASRFTAPTSRTEGRLSTHSPVRWMFCGVSERAPKPSMQEWPSHHALDMGARFDEPSAIRGAHENDRSAEVENCGIDDSVHWDRRLEVKWASRIVSKGSLTRRSLWVAERRHLPNIALKFGAHPAVSLTSSESYRLSR